MKCSRCGEECKVGQTFCLKCGTPIQIEPDINEFESEIADNVGKLLKDDKSDKTLEVTRDLDFLDDEPYDNYGDTMPDNGTLELVDIGEYNEKDENVRPDTNKSFNVDASNMPKIEPPKQPEIKEEEETVDEDIIKEKKIFKAKAIAFSVVAIIVIIIAVVMLTKYSKKESSNKDFVNKYNTGTNQYSDKQYEDAIVTLTDAKSYAKSKSEKIKVNKALLACYQNIENSDNEMIDVLKELIKLEPENVEFYQELISIYDSNNMTDEINALLDSIDDPKVKSNLSEYTVAPPNFSDDSGDYNNNVALKLTSSGNNKIYYTIDGSDPTTASTEYSGVIDINNAGHTTVKAIAVNGQGVSSKIATKIYNIKMAYVTAPAVTPEGGKYDEAMAITVSVPEGMKCYYTYGKQALTPTTGDTPYTTPVPMLRGKNIFSAILVSEDGATVSDVTQVVYQLTINSVLTYDDAEAVLKSYYETAEIASKVLTETGNINEAGEPETEEQYLTPTGDNITFEYNEIADIGNNEYYVIDATQRTQTGSRVSITHYGIDTVTGDLQIIEKDPLDSSKYVIKPQKNETTQDESVTTQ